MKKLITAFLLLTFANIAMADIPASEDKYYNETTLNILLPENTKGWHYYFVDKTVQDTMYLVAGKNAVKIPAGRGLDYLLLYGENKQLNKKSSFTSFMGYGGQVYMVIDSVKSIRIKYRKLTQSVYDSLAIALQPKDTAKTIVAADTLKTANNPKESAKKDNTEPVMIIAPTVFVLILTALAAIAVFFYRRKAQNKKR